MDNNCQPRNVIDQSSCTGIAKLNTALDTSKRHWIHDSYKKRGFNINSKMFERLIYTIILLKSVCLSVVVRKLQVVILARSSQEIS